MAPLISELLDLPDQVYKGDFVLNLSDVVTQPEVVLRDYVVTPQLADCFDNALGFIRSALDAHSSKAAYLHGSFGSGKSHFMAVLHLLLQHNRAARALPELAAVCVKHAWVQEQKLLLVPYHLLGAKDLESAILGGYVEHVRRLHPQAPWPGVYLADDIFANAQQYRQRLGNTRFLQELNQTPDDARWGTMEEGWTIDSLEAALTAPPGDEARIRLVGELVQHFFPAYPRVAAEKEEAYVPLDQGLSILSQHARDLGYDGLVLFLDELILWLASRAADLAFVHREGQKLAKLVESQTPERPVPVISFVARQRDLRELVGERVTGAEQLNFADALKHWEGRFHTITLEDRNLPTIAERRVLRPRDEACRAALDRAWAETASIREEVMDVLLTRTADRQMFRQVYPFSPALVQTLVAVSSALQRERTALKIMLQLLVDKRQTLQVGDLVPVGDLWDVVAHGEEAFSDVLRVNFDNAKRLYHNKLRPMLEEQHEVHLEHDLTHAHTDPELAKRLQRFNNDDRLLKTLLLAALVPEVETLKNLTPGRLAALNHGTIRSPIPGREGQIVLNKLRTWNSLVGEIRLSDDAANPTISIQVVGVDTESIIEKAREYDSPGNRVRKLREMFLEALGLTTNQDDFFLPYTFVWRGTRRTCDVRFENVRELPDEALQAHGERWHVVIDRPYDSDGHNPLEDYARIQQFQVSHGSTRTLVWLPVFFARKSQAELGKLVILDNLLRGENLDQFARHLSLQDRVTARSLLESQWHALTAKLQQSLEAAYGIREPAPEALDTSHDLAERRFCALFSGFAPQPPVGATLKDALEHLLGQALAHEFPAHPEFEREVRPADLRKVFEVARQAAGTEDGRVLVEDRTFRPIVRQIANPLRLGSMSETHFVLSHEWRNHFNRQLAASNKVTPTVGELRAWINQPQPRGLPADVEQLLILVFAEQTNRSFCRYDRAYTPSLESMPDELELRPQPLPTPEDWERAAERITTIFGGQWAGPLTAANAVHLAGKLQAGVQRAGEACGQLPELLLDGGHHLGLPDKTVQRTRRYRTAVAVATLLNGFAGQEPAAALTYLAHATLDTSAAAMRQSMQSAPAVTTALVQADWALYDAVAGLTDSRQAAAQALLRDVSEALQADEYVVTLVPILTEAKQRAIRLLAAALTPVPSPSLPQPSSVKGEGAKRPQKSTWHTVDAGQGDLLNAADWDALAARLQAQLQQNPALRLSLTWNLVREEAP
jgi:hypothetical protein